MIWSCQDAQGPNIVPLISSTGQTQRHRLLDEDAILVGELVHESHRLGLEDLALCELDLVALEMVESQISEIRIGQLSFRLPLAIMRAELTLDQLIQITRTLAHDYDFVRVQFSNRCGVWKPCKLNSHGTRNASPRTKQ